MPDSKSHNEVVRLRGKLATCIGELELMRLQLSKVQTELCPINMSILPDKMEENLASIVRQLKFNNIRTAVLHWEEPALLPVTLDVSTIRSQVGEVLSPFDHIEIQGNAPVADKLHVIPAIWGASLLGVILVEKADLPDLKSMGNLINTMLIMLSFKGFVGSASGVYSNLAKESMTDNLMGIYNNKKLTTDYDTFVRKNVAFVDIDKFKTVNDTYGHKMGDSVLVEFGSLLKAGAEKYKSLSPYRYGGDEVVIVGTDEQELLAYINEVRASLRAVEFVHGKSTFRVTLSVGVATNDIEVTAMKRYLEWADYALYTVKNSGRDSIQVCKVKNQNPPEIVKGEK